MGCGFLCQYICSLSAVLCSLHRYTKDLQPLPLDAPIHSLQPGDSVLVRTWKDEPLQEKWKGPHTVLLVSHTAAKVEGHKNWIHHSCLKAVPAPERGTVQPAEKTASDDLGLKLLFSDNSVCWECPVISLDSCSALPVRTLSIGCVYFYRTGLTWWPGPFCF
uniref:Murine leukemia virus integrase C-terminal domain-containing protein n=1 Tax=Chrysemys picta bellii TaxID=8478 RepID=A0A8C3FVC6_CHRPI